MTFEFISVPRLRFGPGTFDEIGAMVREYGRRAIVVGGRSPARANRVVERLNQAGVSSSTFSVPTEPDVECATKGAEAAREFRADVVVGVLQAHRRGLQHHARIGGDHRGSCAAPDGRLPAESPSSAAGAPCDACPLFVSVRSGGNRPGGRPLPSQLSRLTRAPGDERAAKTSLALACLTLLPSA